MHPAGVLDLARLFWWQHLQRGHRLPSLTPPGHRRVSDSSRGIRSHSILQRITSSLRIRERTTRSTVYCPPVRLPYLLRVLLLNQVVRPAILLLELRGLRLREAQLLFDVPLVFSRAELLQLDELLLTILVLLLQAALLLLGAILLLLPDRFLL